ncbi:hypothetical protein BIZ83_gp168 [Erwinia phage vB_EamM_ChrisDB]|uniref:hypothetical protein n=1 Tax=Erwinia phage vB_EamM_ChrisDB TaxID=1883371 RepID=UPI00081C44D4|nr:hypothetical protein BIZ83_gp168 [Erwinia phage vB_EamM_ChrisDB]ANZ48685.1 hypothetical protein CHRISDB_123 [Erwinia phage vB_EamM_ChrisDB]
MQQLRLVEETEYLSSREWLMRHRIEQFQQQIIRYNHDDEDDRFRLVSVFVGEVRAMALLLLDRGFMVELMGLNTNPEIPVPSVTKLLLRHLERSRIIVYAREYEDQYVEMGLPVVSINYARPIIPGRRDNKHFTANVASLYHDKEQFRIYVRATLGDDPAVESVLNSNGMFSLLITGEGEQVAAIVSRGEKRWVMSDPQVLRVSGNKPATDAVFGRFVECLMACLPKGDTLVYSSTIQAANNRVTWLIMNSFVPESYLHHRALKEN